METKLRSSLKIKILISKPHLFLHNVKEFCEISVTKGRVPITAMSIIKPHNHQKHKLQTMKNNNSHYFHTFQRHLKNRRLMKCNSKKDELSRLLLSEVATGGVLKEFLKISENSQENTFARVSFQIKLQAEVTASLLYSGGILHCYKRNQQESCN